MEEKIEINRFPVTLKDISQRPGYSVNTVSHALNGEKRRFRIRPEN